MSGHVLRRLVLASSVLLGLAAFGGWLLVSLTPVPYVAVLAVGLALLIVEYLVAPAVVEWLVPATVVERTEDGRGYRSDEPVAAIVARQCQLAGVPLVRLGLVDDGDPNAFTFGRSRRDARVWISRGLLERLDDREVEAVVAHEIGHVAGRDVALMTAASVVPMLLYYASAGAHGAGANAAAGGGGGDTSNNNEPFRLLLVVGYVLSELAFLSLSRARELAADHASCAATGDGDALCSALVKIVYGIGEVSEERAERLRSLRADDEHREARRLARRENRMRAAGALGIAGAGASPAFDALGPGLPPHPVLAAMRWDIVSPWARFLELFSTHPRVVGRIAALERSGLPGRPRDWQVLPTLAAATADDRGRARARTRFALELPAYAGGWICLLSALVLTVSKARGAGPTAPWQTIGFLLAAAGGILLVRAVLRCPPGVPEPVAELACLVERTDASPVAGTLVSLRGRVVGRGGHITSADLVLADDSGFVPVLYRQPLPGMATIFAFLHADDFVGEEVVVTGWYLRRHRPYVELRSVTSESGLTVRSRTAAGRYVCALLFLVAGCLLVALAV